jgi:hypothetical protein
MSSNKNEVVSGSGIPQGLKLLIGVGGIYAAFLYYGTLQEDVFHYKAADGTKFTSAWFLQALGKTYKCTNSSFSLPFSRGFRKCYLRRIGFTYLWTNGKSSSGNYIMLNN